MCGPVASLALGLEEQVVALVGGWGGGVCLKNQHAIEEATDWISGSFIQHQKLPFQEVSGLACRAFCGTNWCSCVICPIPESAYALSPQTRMPKGFRASCIRRW